MQIKRCYKIHSLDTANGLRTGARNDCFYDDYDEALAKAKSYVSRDGTPMVIYEAIMVIQPVPVVAPIEIIPVDTNRCSYHV